MSSPERYVSVNAPGEMLAAAERSGSPVDVEAVFTAHYPRVARVVARVIRDRGRAEELAVDVFLKWLRHPAAHGDGAAGWLYRTAVRMGLDELRREARRGRFERLLSAFRQTPATPADVHESGEEQQRVRGVLAALRRSQAELLVFRSQGFSYDELAAALGLNAASVGTLLSRAQQAFRKEYVKRHGPQ